MSKKKDLPKPVEIVDDIAGKGSDGEIVTWQGEYLFVRDRYDELEKEYNEFKELHKKCDPRELKYYEEQCQTARIEVKVLERHCTTLERCLELLSAAIGNAPPKGGKKP